MSHTPLPWHWGEDADKIDDGKYYDMRLIGPNGEEVIPIRIDHNSPVWDTPWWVDGEEPDGELIPSKADRELITTSVNGRPGLLAMLKECVPYVQRGRFCNPPADALLARLYEALSINPDLSAKVAEDAKG